MLDFNVWGSAALHLKHDKHQPAITLKWDLPGCWCIRGKTHTFENSRKKKNGGSSDTMASVWYRQGYFWQFSWAVPHCGIPGASPVMSNIPPDFCPSWWAHVSTKVCTSPLPPHVWLKNGLQWSGQKLGVAALWCRLVCLLANGFLDLRSAAFNVCRGSKEPLMAWQETQSQLHQLCLFLGLTTGP